ncbi:MAG: MarR family transcriptional regulator [Bacteroidales bacterium]|jgi:DNA-binding MarR family transcriptional regulator
MEHTKLSEFADDIVSIKPFFYKSFGRPGYLSSNITPGAYYVLHLLAREGELSMTEIGERLFISKPNVTTLIDKLIENGFTERLPDKQDRRIIKIRVTKKGMSLIEKSKKSFCDQVKKKLLTLSQEELNRLFASFQTIKEILYKLSAVKNQ